MNKTTSEPGLAAREGAAAILTAVLKERRAMDDAFADEASAGTLARAEPRDRAFARAIAATAIRRLGTVDRVLSQLIDKELPKRAGATANILRAGVTEILFLRVAHHAAVSMNVEAASRDATARHYKALVNAVLRRTTREGDAILDNLDTERLDTPDWLWESWTAAYGEETARAIIRTHYEDPPLDLSVKTESDLSLWAERLGATILPTGTLRLEDAGRIEDLPGFTEGAWWVQDAAAALPVKLLGDVAGRDVLDLCAAPGGKTAALAASGGHVTALDRSKPRLERLTENLSRLGLAAETVTADAGSYDPGRQWDRVLLDAPCTATGTARRHPDVLRLKSPADRDKLAALQARLLTRAAELTAPGGTLVYCTCSLEPEEGVRQIGRFLEANGAFRRRPVTSEEVGGLAEILTDEGDIRSLPCHMGVEGGMDGFYAARLERA
ncbi:RsmB/NOP family class I SAM-dependent RNA methyltransferase [Parvibaculum sp.]|uniref:RsmB/NOP family class I SAM-dependent RNA methyltransferase n=1 Tax=Parvibaculum sp. TaxID=2024848 RepID=UPI001B0A414A|nr:RsmB/NOP family class I SAM-dependent RNA methyltransferase [Parvibaculum sp.]MBO6677391.1 RsmB/NOP family class I SAM-dependent RNA methyltransferase [Parvibaculum sp.]MBO6684542.1 RsmB/NOP family class I SAM-dependent RNA methyltransferase [Parvibaculum sp.]MBO6905741.1 RsmB/NOP family class I SAM-dependent RNA methyltransferase [Parvibaculum sp.]